MSIDLEKSNIIYGLIDPRCGNIRYIGKTVTSLRVRLYRHFTYELSNDTYKSRWLKKLISLNMKPLPIIIHELKENENINELEIFFIDKYKKEGFNLVNTAPGGQGGPMTPETKYKISLANKGRKPSKETIQKIKDAHKKNKRIISQQERDKISELTKIAMNNPLIKLKMSLKAKGKIPHNKNSGKLFICNQTNKTYNSCIEAAKELKVQPANIYKVLKGQRKNTMGYTFSYIEGEYNV